jgi:hypothetical protein
VDQATLVTEKLEAGKEFIDELTKVIPVKIAFWLKREDESQWYLYVASDDIRDVTKRSGYEKALRVALDLGNGNLDPFEVKLLKADDRLAVAAWEIQQRYQNKPRVLYRDRELGGVGIEGAYIYPTPGVAATP